MSIAKKTKKMINNPRSFLADSNYKIVRKLNLLFPKKNVIKKKGLIKNNNKKNLSPETFNIDNSINHKRHIPSSLINERELFPLLGKRLLLIKTGIEYIDENRCNYFQNSGFNVSFTDCFIDEEIDDFEYKSRTSEKFHFNSCNEIINDCKKLNIDTVVFPYDCTNNMGGILLSLRAISVNSLVYLLPLDAILREYELCDYKFLSDYILVDSESSSSISDVTAVRDVYGVPPISNQYTESTVSRYRLGLSPANDVIILFTPAIQLQVDEQEYQKTLEIIFNKVEQRINNNTHLIIVLKNKKNVFLSEEVNKKLIKFHRLTKLTYSNSSLILGALKGSIVYAPYGMLSSGTFELIEYSFDKSINIIDRSNEVSWIKRHKKINILTQLENIFNNFDNPILDVLDKGTRKIAVPDPITNEVITEGRQKYLLQLLNCNERLYGASDVKELFDATYFVQWGAEPNEPKSRPEKNRIALKRPKLLLEDGFIRSLDLWTDPNVPTLSVVMDYPSYLL